MAIRSYFVHPRLSRPIEKINVHFCCENPNNHFAHHHVIVSTPRNY
jgi:hypothetical protein